MAGVVTSLSTDECLKTQPLPSGFLVSPPLQIECFACGSLAVVVFSLHEVLREVCMLS